MTATATRAGTAARRGRKPRVTTRICDAVRIPIRGRIGTRRQDAVVSVATGTMVGFSRGLVLVRWGDGLVVPYFPDQIWIEPVRDGRGGWS